MVDIVREVGKEQGYTMIFARGAGGMIYNREGIDMTDLVVEKFNKKG
jgi:Skp family chaperone for outer membrane proteins